VLAFGRRTLKVATQVVNNLSFATGECVLIPGKLYMTANVWIWGRIDATASDALLMYLTLLCHIARVAKDSILACWYRANLESRATSVIHKITPKKR
jgi:hypothetical protein